MQTTEYIKSEDTSKVTLGGLMSIARARCIVVAGVAFGALILVIYQHFRMSSYNASALMLVGRAENSPIQAFIGKSSGVGSMFGDKSNEYLDKYITYLESYEFDLQVAKFMTSDPAASDLVKKLMPKKRWGLETILYEDIYTGTSADEAESKLARSLRAVSRFRKVGSDNIIVETGAKTPEFAVEEANYLASKAVKIIIERELDELGIARKYMEAQLAATSGRIDTLDSEAIDFKKKNGFRAYDPGNVYIDKIKEIQSELQGSQTTYDQNEKLIRILGAELKKQESSLFNNGGESVSYTSTVVSELRQRIQAMRYKKALMEAQGYSAESWQLKELDQELDHSGKLLKDAIAKEGGKEESSVSLLYNKDELSRKITMLESANQMLKLRISALQSNLDQSMKPLAKVPEMQQHMTEIGRAQGVELGLATDVRKRIFELEIEGVSLANKIRVIEPASIAGVPPHLNLLPKLVLGLLFGLAAGLIAAMGIEKIDATVKSIEDLSGLGLPALANIPVTDIEKRTSVLKWRNQARVATIEADTLLKSWRIEPEEPMRVAISTLRERLLRKAAFLGDLGEGRAFAVASPNGGFGQAFVAINLALSLSKLGKRVLLVDVDAAEASLSSALGISAAPCVWDLLKGLSSIDACVSKISEGGLSFLPAIKSRSGATDLLSGPVFVEFIKLCRKKFAYTVLTSSALLSCVDGAIVGGQADLTLMVATWRKTKAQDLTDALAALTEINPGPVFSVLNEGWRLSKGNADLVEARSTGGRGNLSYEPNLRKVNDANIDEHKLDKPWDPLSPRGLA